MDLKKIKSLLDNTISVKQIAPKEFQISIMAVFPNKKPLFLYLENFNKNTWLLNDKKQTMKYLIEFFDMSAPDVKGCINSVLKTHKFKIQGGTLFTELNDIMMLPEILFEFIICIGQLVFMHAFFVTPN